MALSVNECFSFYFYTKTSIGSKQLSVKRKEMFVNNSHWNSWVEQNPNPDSIEILETFEHVGLNMRISYGKKVYHIQCTLSNGHDDISGRYIIYWLSMREEKNEFGTKYAAARYN